MKRLFSFFCIFTICLSIFSSAAFADYNEQNTSTSSVAESAVQPRAEETEWYWRINNGNYEKRLWSITYGKWLTDWIYVGPVT